STEGAPETIKNAFATAMRGEDVKSELPLRLPIGDRHFDFEMRPLRDQHGAIVGAVPEAVDITERRRGEEALRQSQK
ncbi:PAS domain-containing protein, partial [Salmonella enterica subsp. enterica serovar Infantis]